MAGIKFLKFDDYQTHHDAEQKILDSMMPVVLQANAGGRIQMHLMNSKDEHTYQRYIADLIYDLNKNGINILANQNSSSNTTKMLLHP